MSHFVWALRAGWGASWGRQALIYLLVAAGGIVLLAPLTVSETAGAWKDLGLWLRVLPASMVMGVLLRAARRRRAPAQPFLVLAPTATLPRRAALLFVDYAPVLLLGALMCWALPASLRPRAASIAVGCLALGAAGSWPRTAAIGGLSGFLLLALVIDLVPAALLVGLAVAVCTFDVGRALASDDAGDRPAGFGRWGSRAGGSVIALLLTTEPLARLPLAVAAVGAIGIWHFPGGSYGIPQALACGFAGAALGRFLTGPPGRALAVWPLGARRLLLPLLAWTLAMLVALPAAVLANGARLGEAGARRHLETRARENKACTELTPVCESKWRDRLARYLHARRDQLPPEAVVTTVAPDGATVYGPGPWAAHQFVRGTERTAMAEALVGVVYAGFGVFTSLQLVARRQRRSQALALVIAGFFFVLAAEQRLLAFDLGAEGCSVLAALAAGCVLLVLALLRDRSS